MHINFYTLKWGDKYGPEYVNRLYGSLLKHYHNPFTFTCYTDNAEGIRSEVIIEDINKLRIYDTKKVFTYEKLILMDHHESGIWIDLDLLIHKDITNINLDKDFIMIWNYWNPLSRSYAWYGKGSSCHVNSSFVYWNNPEWLKRFTHDNWKKIEWTYKSLDKYMFYQHHRTEKLHYWPSDLVSNYNRQEFKLDNKITIFNTSHIQANNLTEEAFELHEADKGVLALWKSYDL